MKHILIIISILLLTSSLFGQSKETGVLYRWENGTEYVGEWKDGKKHGQGTFTYGKGKWEGEKYVGKFKDGYRNGQGTYTWSDGDKYVGEFKDGKKHGQGTWTSTGGEKYSGEWKVGKKYGQGTLIYPEKDKFLGEFKGKPWNGKWYDKNGNILYKLVYGESVR